MIINPCKVAVAVGHYSLSKNAKVIQSVRGPEKTLEKGDPESNEGINLVV